MDNCTEIKNKSIKVNYTNKKYNPTTYPQIKIKLQQDYDKITLININL